MTSQTEATVTDTPEIPALPADDDQVDFHALLPQQLASGQRLGLALLANFLRWRP